MIPSLEADATPWSVGRFTAFPGTMALMAAGENWKRLGRMLVERRVELGYRHRNVFAEAAGFTNDRVLADLENARRTNFSPATKAQVELAIGWEPGSIDAILDGGEPSQSDTAPVSEGGSALQDDEVPIGQFSDEHLLAIVSERLSGYKRRIAVLEARLEDAQGATDETGEQ